MPRANSPWAVASGYRLRVLGFPTATASEAAAERVMPSNESSPMVLPVYDPGLAMIVDLLPYNRPRTRGPRLELQSVRAGELWIIDERVDSRAVLMNWPRQGGAFIVAEAGAGEICRATEEPSVQGELDGGAVYEEALEANDETGGTFALRRIVWRLDGLDADAGECNGETIYILTNAPSHLLDAVQAVRLFRMPWRERAPLPIESIVDEALLAAVPPRAAWLATGVVALAFNMLSTIMSVVGSTLELEERELAKLVPRMATGIGAAYTGMMIALPPDDWRRFDTLPDSEMREILWCLAIHLDPRSERRKRRDQRTDTKSQASLRAATLERLLRDDGELHAAGPFKPHTIAMATRDFSANPSRALRYANESLVMVTKYNRPIALLVSIDDWNRLMGEVRETNIERVSLECAGHSGGDCSAMFGERSFN
jgi:hypothetical protein